jgi:hypothetical protein
MADCPNCAEEAPNPKVRKIDKPVRRSYLTCPLCGKARRRTPSQMQGRATRDLVNEARVLQERLRIAVQQTRLRVLVWGPMPTSKSALAEKRKQIRTELTELGSEVFFSEDFAFGGSPVNLQELIQLSGAGLVILLADSPGTLGELHDFGLELGNKLLTWMRRESKAGYTGTGLREMMRTTGNEPLFFDELDIDSCVLSLASADWVDDWRRTALFIKEKTKLLGKVDPTKPIS